MIAHELLALGFGFVTGIFPGLVLLAKYISEGKKSREFEELTKKTLPTLRENKEEEENALKALKETVARKKEILHNLEKEIEQKKKVQEELLQQEEEKWELLNAFSFKSSQKMATVMSIVSGTIEKESKGKNGDKKLFLLDVDVPGYKGGDAFERTLFENLSAEAVALFVDSINKTSTLSEYAGNAKNEYFTIITLKLYVCLSEEEE